MARLGHDSIDHDLENLPSNDTPLVTEFNPDTYIAQMNVLVEQLNRERHRNDMVDRENARVSREIRELRNREALVNDALGALAVQGGVRVELEVVKQSESFRTAAIAKTPACFTRVLVDDIDFVKDQPRKQAEVADQLARGVIRTLGENLAPRFYDTIKHRTQPATPNPEPITFVDSNGKYF